MRAITGANIIGGAPSHLGDTMFTGFDPRTGRAGDVRFAEATPREVAMAVDAAAEASDEFGSTPPDQLARLLDTIADSVDANADALIDVADAETALGKERLRGESARASGQFRSFARLLERGESLEAVIDTARPEDTPPRPDIRRMQRPIGPVAVFGASNFPFAFSVLGGDVASALAAGCPVVAKAHPAHPATSELSATLLVDAIRDCHLPAGAFSLLQGQSVDVGETLVQSPAIRAVGFTGSLRAGRSLYDLAARRPVPIPVFAEMGSLNPVFVTAGVLDERLDAFAQGFVASMTLGGGQFCTKPGLLIVPAERSDALRERLKSLLELTKPVPMLSERVRDGLTSQVAGTLATRGVREVVRVVSEGGSGFTTDAVLAVIDGPTFLTSPGLAEEHFGAFALMVTYASRVAMTAIAMALQGTLTATIHCQGDEVDDVGQLASILQRKAGRLIWNGFPTGVAVTEAMEHGGPYPATTFSEHTSVGSFAIRRWLRPVCFQSCPDDLLPAALQKANPLHLRRLVNAEWTTAEN